ncbi:helix-turn-helix domain-containing protein [Actinocrispum wychmicini]|uniref:AraC-like DNA-binding protein n=1 Tax=Actinocrispum wychmicini TaxID=1213861 RepID=A0A4R2IT43_9PSEU|nr:AraC family transcriptional regulator [Actinocrispum wychmicini]TCO47429.1 AraC-like DNA-binding protein [Actinocrispum wychmicini]
MEEPAERAVERAIGYMRANLGEQITIDDLARAAMFSKFYFTRLFQRVTGMSPGRFLSAVRIQRAKDLLLATSMTVTEVSYRVGYNSMGTFSSRFRESVGVSPTAYRQQSGVLVDLPGEVGVGQVDLRAATVRGRILTAWAGQVGSVFVGLFPSRLPHGEPIRWTVRPQPGLFLLDNVPPGRCYLVADALATGPGGSARYLAEPDSYVAAQGPIVVRRDTDIRLADLWLRPSTVFDPPLLLARLAERSVPVAVAEGIKFAA